MRPPAAIARSRSGGPPGLLPVAVAAAVLALWCALPAPLAGAAAPASAATFAAPAAAAATSVLTAPAAVKPPGRAARAAAASAGTSRTVAPPAAADRDPDADSSDDDDDAAPSPAPPALKPSGTGSVSGGQRQPYPPRPGTVGGAGRATTGGSGAGGGAAAGGSASPAASGAGTGAATGGTAAAKRPDSRRVRLAAVPSKGLRVHLETGLDARMSGDGEISIEAQPRRGESFAALAQRLCGDSRLLPQLLESNHLRSGARPALHTSYHLPFEILATAWQLKAAQALFPEDRGEATGWRHQVRGLGALRQENLWQLSEWFTGKGENFRAIREYNSLHDEEVAQGAVLTIPAELLRPAFGAALVVPEKPIALTYGKDEQGEYAVYRLRPGEALYSGVVVRFTGRIYAADVNALAADIAHRSGIDDVTAIPVGFKVKIPLDLLQPEFLPDGDPRRKEYEAGLRASSQFSNQVRARGLEGITVVLDAGHGGLDSGATNDGVWESLYVYDIVVRLKRALEAHTAATVRLTTRDGDDFTVVDSDVLPISRRHAVLTNPPYLIEDPAVGVNLRWYLTNSLYRRAISADNDPQKVVFLSIHADSLHPSLRGAMAYIPAARMRNESYGKSGAVYESRAEFRESPRVEFPWDQRVQSEGLSRELAKQVIGAFEDRSLPVHPFDPVRDHIIRKRSEWVPAVLRYNSVPAKMLLEVCNLNNDLDRGLLQTRAYRQRVADAILDGLLAYYSQSPSQPAVRVARAAK